MYTEGTFLEGQDFLVDTCSIGETKKGAKFLKLVLRNKEKTLAGNLWDYSEGLHAFVKPGIVVTVSGAVGTYNNSPQITLKSIAPSSTPIGNFARSTTLDCDMMWNDLARIIEGFSEPLTKFVASELVLKLLPGGFKLAPAARSMHNAWYGGLMEHVWSMCQTAKTVIPHYTSCYKVTISSDKVYFGLIAHDLGKVIEYDCSTPAFTDTPLGILTNHLVLGPAWIYEQAAKWWATPNDGAPRMTAEEFKLERAHLMHLVAAHHGKKEWGSPVPPATLEAIIVHQLDMLDSKVMHAMDYVLHKPGQIPGFTERSYAEATCFLRPTK